MELEGLKKDLNKVSVRTQEVLASPQKSASAPVLRSELDLTVQKMDHAHMLSSIYLDKWVPTHLLRVNAENVSLCPYALVLNLLIVSCPRLKTVEMVIRNTQGAEGVLKQYEDCLREVHTVPSDVKEVETYRTTLKVNYTWFFIRCLGSEIQHMLEKNFLNWMYICIQKNTNHPLSQLGTVPFK